MRRWAAGAALCTLAAVAAPGVAADVAGSSSATVIRDGVAAMDVFGPEDSVEFGSGPADIAAEPSVAADPTDARHAVVVFKAGFGHAIGYAVTRDAGKTWSPTQALPRTLRRDLDQQTFIATTDPVVAFGPDGTAYVAFIGFTEPRNGLAGNVEVMSMAPGTASWAGPFDAIAEPALGPPYSYPDKEWMAVDTGRGPGHHPGRLYVMWSQEPLLPLATFSDDGGRTWQQVPSPVLPASVTGGGVPTHGTDVQLVVLRDGALGAFYDTGDYAAAGAPDGTVPEQYRFVRAPAPAAGGTLAFEAPVGVADAHHYNAPDFASVADPAATGVDPRTGTLYSVWADNAGTAGFNDVVMSLSRDDGLTWSAPQRLNTDRDGDHLNPAITVTAKGAVIASWRQRPALPTGALGDDVLSVVRGAADGHAFDTQTVLTATTTDLRWAERSAGQVFLGDYDQVATSGPFTYVARAEAACATGSACDPATASPRQRIWVAVLSNPE